MRLFISYARVDKPYCMHIVDTLEAHDVWYDYRLYAGQQWWREILMRLDWCEGFVYLLSPDSVSSEYCRKEFEIALSLGKRIFPVLIHENTQIPKELVEVQYVDMSKGRTPDSVKALLNSIYYAERQGRTTPSVPVSSISADEIKQPTVNTTTIIGDIATAMESGQFDRAVFLIRQAISNHYESKYINLENLLRDAESGLEHQTNLREASREYKQIAELIKRQRTRQLGCEAFAAFRKAFPDYDPENLITYCQAANGAKKSQFTLPLLEWCEIPTGFVKMVKNGDKNGASKIQSYYVESFYLSKYPVTNAQFQAFVDDPQGYANPEWWKFSKEAFEWRLANPIPKAPQFKGDERPREHVNWYEAVAFCKWLSSRTGLRVTLPTELQWQRAAQGDDDRLYPWGMNFDPGRCNTSESNMKVTTLVMRYENGASPYGPLDMAGNVWEWCLNKPDLDSDLQDLSGSDKRVIRGGCFLGSEERARTNFRYTVTPLAHYGTIGFRLAYLPGEA